MPNLDDLLNMPTPKPSTQGRTLDDLLNEPVPQAIAPDIDIIKSGMEDVATIAGQAKVGTLPEYQPATRVPGIIGQLPGGMGRMAREVPAGVFEQQYIKDLRNVYKGTGTPEEKK